jgi:DHA1 family tetracycline resistance protein-like MFS transporter
MKPTKKLLYFLTFILMTNFINNTILTPILTPLFLKPEYNFFLPQTSFETRAFLLGITSASYPLALFLGSPIFSKLCDSIGRKKILLITGFFTGLGNLITAMGIESKAIYLIILGRLISGIIGCTSTPIKTIISDISDSTNRNKNFSYVSVALCLSLIIGPLVGSELSNKEVVSWFNFSTPLHFLFLISMLILPLIFIYIKETIQNVVPFKLNLISSFTQIKEIISIKDLQLIMIVLLCYSMGYFVFSSSFMTYLVKKFNITSREIGFIGSYSGCVFLFAQIFIYAPFSKYLKLETIISLALIIFPCSILATLSINNFYYIYFILIPILTARSFLQTPLVLCVAAKSTADTQGKFHGYHSSIYALGELFGPVLGGFLIGKFVWLPFIFSSVIMLGAFFVIQKIKRQDIKS